MTQPRVILAVDAGGSSTRCMLASTDGSVLGFGTGGPGNHILSGWETTRASFRDATANALRSAGAVAASVAVAVAGSAGVGPNGQGREVIEWLLTDLVPQAARVQATGDMVASFWGALPVPVGVVVTAGTGSVAFGRNPGGRTCQVGGWGHIMGDEGSAYDIATRALRAMARAVDGRAAPTALTPRLIAAIGESSAVDAAVRLYTGSGSREEIASLAVHVTAAAECGDTVAVAILRRAGEELGLMAATALHTLELHNEPVSVSFAGSVFDAGRWVCQPFAAAIQAATPAARIEPPLLSPLGGAFRLATAMLGTVEDDGVIEHLRSELARYGG